jgi:glycerol-3-phosphate O-acyltransferase
MFVIFACIIRRLYDKKVVQRYLRVFIVNKYVTEYSVCGSRAWARSRLGRVTPESATYASLCRAFLENQSQP